MSLKPVKVVLGLIALAVLIQFIPVPRTNPPVTAQISAPPELLTVLRRACYDCHSNETTWPWYSKIAPSSWLVAWDVFEGRDHLNFSGWEQLPQEKQAKLRKKIHKEVSDEEMPPGFYLLAHPNARLSEQDKGIIFTWTGQGSTQ